MSSKKKLNRGAAVAMIVLAVILVPVLLINLTLIVKGSIYPDSPPDVFGIAPLAVTSGSMEGDQKGSFDEGALIFVKKLSAGDKNNLEEGDVITFLTDGVYVTHRIVSVNKNSSGDSVSFVTKGDANNVSDGAIPAQNVFGKCVGSIAGLGGFMLFLLTPAGILLFVGLPILIYVAVDVLLIALHNRKVAKTQGDNATDEKI